MITCQNARLLFDRHLDGELSPSLQAELHAHQLSCTECQSELALLEACGDVIASDRCEPQLSEAFTDRVLLAHRAQGVRRRPRWARRIALFGTPVAAAASIVLMMSLAGPTPPVQNKTAVLGGREEGSIVAAPVAVRDALKELKGTDLSEQATREMNRAPEMASVTWIDTALVPMVRQARGLADSLQGNAEQLKLLVTGLADTNEKLAAERKSGPRKGSSSEAGSDRELLDDLDAFYPNLPVPEPADESPDPFRPI